MVSLALLAAVLSACSLGSGEPKASGTAAPHTAPVLGDARPPVSPAIVTGTLPHDRTAFTEGFAFWQGRLFESTGIYGVSVLREIDPANGRELRRTALDPTYFGEGITILHGRLYQLTWREQTCLVYDAASFHKVDELVYQGEGWGLTNDGVSLIMSDGSEWIRYRDAATFQITRSVRVTLAGRPVQQLNELEYIRGEIWANVWYSDMILRISPADGRVLAVLDASNSLHGRLHASNPDDVLNGIAFDAASGRLLLTGKRWPVTFQVAPPP